MPDPAFWTAKGLAERWACHLETVRRMLRRGDLAAVRIGGAVRVPHDAVTAYEARQTVAAKHDRQEPDQSSEDAVERFRLGLRLDHVLDRRGSG